MSCSYIAFEEQMHSHNTLTRSTVRGDQHEESFPLAEEADLRDALTRMGFQGALVEAVLGEPSKTKTRTVESLVERLSELLVGAHIVGLARDVTVYLGGGHCDCALGSRALLLRGHAH